MRLRAFRLIFLLSFLIYAGWAGHEFPAQPGESTRPGGLIVKLQPGVTTDNLVALLPPLSHVERLHGRVPLVRVSLPPGLTIAPGLLKRIADDLSTVYVEPDRIRGVNLATNSDPSFGSQWAL